MTNSQRLQLVRERISQWLAANGLPTTDNIAESILIRDGFYCGRRFKIEQCTAVWFTEDDQIKIYDADNHLLASFFASDEQVEEKVALRRAA